MQVDLRILRYDPERDDKPHWESYAVESDPRNDRVLDLLHRVKYDQDGSLTFRRSCAHGVCGSDAMLINGRNRLACKVRVEQLGKRRITIAPLPGLPDFWLPATPYSGLFRLDCSGDKLASRPATKPCGLTRRSTLL